MKLTSEQQTILRTVAYADVFDYPLTMDEIYRRQIFSPDHKTLSLHQIQKVIKTIPDLTLQQGLVFFTKNKQAVELRNQRQQWSDQKWKEVKRIKKLLARMPFVIAVYITGALAMNNIANANDDIDILVITQKDRIWLTRLITVPIAILLRKYRFHDSRQQTGWCFNLWLDENSLVLPINRRSLYSAYEVMQAKPIIGHDNILLKTNPWIKEFLPMVKASREQLKTQQVNSIGDLIFNQLNWLAYQLQWVIMKKHHTIERIGLGFAFFHPRDTQGLIMKKLEKIINNFQ